MGNRHALLGHLPLYKVISIHFLSFTGKTNILIIVSNYLNASISDHIWQPFISCLFCLHISSFLYINFYYLQNCWILGMRNLVCMKACLYASVYARIFQYIIVSWKSCPTFCWLDILWAFDWGMSLVLSFGYYLLLRTNIVRAKLIPTSLFNSFHSCRLGMYFTLVPSWCWILLIWNSFLGLICSANTR